MRAQFDSRIPGIHEAVCTTGCPFLPSKRRDDRGRPADRSPCPSAVVGHGYRDPATPPGSSPTEPSKDRSRTILALGTASHRDRAGEQWFIIVTALRDYSVCDGEEIVPLHNKLPLLSQLRLHPVEPVVTNCLRDTADGSIRVRRINVEARRCAKIGIRYSPSAVDGKAVTQIRVGQLLRPESVNSVVLKHNRIAKRVKAICLLINWIEAVPEVMDKRAELGLQAINKTKPELLLMRERLGRAEYGQDVRLWLVGGVLRPGERSILAVVPGQCTVLLDVPPAVAGKRHRADHDAELVQVRGWIGFDFRRLTHEENSPLRRNACCQSLRNFVANHEPPISIIARVGREPCPSKHAISVRRLAKPGLKWAVNCGKVSVVERRRCCLLDDTHGMPVSASLRNERVDTGLGRRNTLKGVECPFCTERLCRPAPHPAPRLA